MTDAVHNIELRMIKKQFFVLIFSMVSMLGWSQDLDTASASQPVYKFSFDSTTFLLGDQTVLAIESGSPLPTIEDLTNNDIVAVRQWMDSTNGTFYTALTSFEVGEHWLHIGADSVLLTVNDVANVDTTSSEIKDIAPIFRQPYTFGEVATVVGIVLGVLAILAAAYFFYRRWKEHKPIIALPKAPPVPADVRALNELESLRQRQLWQQGMIKEYHTQLTDVLRGYLEETYHIPSSEMTTDQTLDAFRCCPAYSAESEQNLRQILQTADMVKFAKSEPQPYQHDLSMTQSVAFVRATAPRPEPQTEQPGSTATETFDKQ